MDIMPGERWTKEELESLLYQLRVERKSLPLLQVAKKSLAAVNNQRQRLQRAGLLDGVFAGRHLAPWSIRELNELRKLTREYGFSAAFIAQLQLIPGRTAQAISKMMTRHGLGNPDVKRRARNACRLTAEERRKLQHFLLNEGRPMPSVRVAKAWGLAQKTVTAYRRRLGVSLSWEEARSSEDYQLNQGKRARAFSAQLYTRWAEWRIKREQRLRALKAALQQSPMPPASRTCCACGEQWFATKEFFNITRKRSGTFSMSHTCLLCRSAKQRCKTQRQKVCHARPAI
jgi:hypothetical protein